MNTHVDIFIIGGGINGAGIARDAAGRGYSVALCEMNDLASGTSCESSKLIHGGIRYLEHYEFLLVRKALKEREILWAAAPHIIAPGRFILPHHRELRPTWMLRIGLFLYDFMGGRRLLPASRRVNLADGPYGKPLKGSFKTGFQYSDCQVDDARLVVLNAVDAAARGAEIGVGEKCISAQHEGGLWKITTKRTAEDKSSDRSGDTFRHYTADIIINAAGPWVDQVLEGAFGQEDPHNVRMVKGSHIVVPKLYQHDNCYIFQNADERVIFAIPWKHDTTLIGTTDVDYDGDPANAEINEDEVRYLCEAASEYFKNPLEEKNIIWSFSGVRPLYDDGADEAQEATRDYVFRQLGGDDGGPAVINIFGGKITTYRVLAEKILDEIEEIVGRKGRPWTAKSALPGGDFPATGFDRLLQTIRARYPFLTNEQSARMCHAYGTRIVMVLGQADSASQLGEDFGCGLREVEVRYLMVNEWARCADDVVWRRSKLGLVMTPEQIKRLDDWMAVEQG